MHLLACGICSGFRVIIKMAAWLYEILRIQYCCYKFQ